jgi:hypothetical protein
MDDTAMKATDWITAISTAVSALASVVLFLVAFVQLRGLRDQLKQSADQEKRRNTLDVVERVEHDPALIEAYKSVWEKTTGGVDYTKTTECKYHVITILNYFEGVAIGIAQNIYVESMARDYLENILKKATEVWLIGESTNTIKAPAKMFENSEYSELRSLYRKWFPPQTTTYKADSY